jgi:soluble lytic murein transglycosylase
MTETMQTRLFWAGVLWLLYVLLTATQASADIYRYKDKDGVWHFTNLQTDARYQLYMRTPEATVSEYLEKYDDVITQAARRFGLDPYLIKAIIKAESNFDYEAVSRKGAQGLMQLMPPTADAMEVDNPFNPEENILGGTRYFSLLLSRFDNRMEWALAAYNAGPEAVEASQGIPPYPETQAFVERVLKYYREYNGGAR